LFAAISVSLHGASPAGPGASPSPDHGRIVGALSCQSSLCHGGASPSRYQYTIWYHNDRHSQAYAALVSSYGVNMAKALGIASPTTDVTCAACHAPLALPGADVARTADVTEGVSCEVCHNGAASWLRSHTRADYTYANRVTAGLADLRDTFVRANTCVQCHQAIDPKLIHAGHPALTFELDGQTASEPRHWKEKSDWFGAKAWLVGQAVALRDISAQIDHSAAPLDDQSKGELTRQQDALLWLLHQVPNAGSAGPPDSGAGAWSAGFAKSISDQAWSMAMSDQALVALAGTADSFLDAKVDAVDQHARAERLVLALDRLFKATHPLPASDNSPPAEKPQPLPGEAELTALFQAVDAPQFDPKSFSSCLHKFADIVVPGK
jgi:hypothetical protein